MKPKPRSKRDPPVPAALFAKDLSLRAGPVPVPLQLLIPSIDVTTQVLGVGVTDGDVMDAPEGPVDDPVWQRRSGTAAARYPAWSALR